MGKKWNSIALVFPLEFRDFLTFIILEIWTHYNKKCKESFWMNIGKFSWKESKNPCCTSGITLLLSSLLNFEIFLHSLFWKYENSIKMKLQGIFLNVFWKILVKEKKIPCCRSGIPLPLSFLLNFEIFCIHYSGNTKIG